MSGLLIFFVVILVIAVVGLTVGLVYLYKRPEETSLMPYNIYGGQSGAIAPGRFAQGVLTQSSNYVQTTPLADATKDTSQWYLVPSAGHILFQNVSTKEYITIDDKTLIVTMTSNMVDATPFVWQINQVNGASYFVYHNTTVTCTSNYFYLSFVNVNTNVAVLCISNNPTGFFWGVAPVIAGLVG